MSQNKGRLYTLWKQFGWFEAAPNNFTKEERRRNMDGGDWNSNAIAQYYHANSNASKDYSSHQHELDEMAQYEMVKPIISLYAEECTQPDINKKKILWYRCSNADIERELNEMLNRVDAEEHMFSIAFNLAGRGNSFRRILRNEQGIQQIVAVENREVERVWEPSTKRLIGFKWAGNTPYTPDDSISYMGDKELFAPWEFIHFRRIEDNTTEYGIGLIEHLFGTYRKIKMAVDNMVVYRLHTMPTRYWFWLDCGNMTIWEMMNQANQTRNLLRNQVSIDLSAGSDQMTERYNPPATDSILFFPFRKGEEHKLEKMEGTRDVPDVHDLDLLFKMLFGGARVPKAYIGFEEDSGGLAKASLVSQDIRFARMIRVLRKPIIQGFKRLAELHLAFKGQDPDQFTIEVEMSRISSIEEETNASTMEMQVSLASNLASLCQMLDIPNKEIIDLVFKNYLHVPKEFVEIAKLAAAIEKAIKDNRDAEEQDMMGAGGVPGAPMSGPGGGVDLGADLGLGGDLGADPGADGMTDPLAAASGVNPAQGGAGGLAGAAGAQESMKGNNVLLVEFFREVGKKYNKSMALLEDFKGHRNSLMEAIKDNANIRDAFNFSEEVGKTRLQFNRVLDAKINPKCSLVEAYAGLRTPITERGTKLDESTRQEEYVKLVETYDKIQENSGYRSRSEEHPAVSMVSRMRH